VSDARGGTRYVLLMLQYITARKLAEQELRDNEVRFRALFESSPLGIAFVDRDNVIIETNDAYGTMFNKPRDAVVGTSFGTPLPPEEGNWRSEVWSKLLSGEIDSITADRPVIDDSARADWVSVVSASVRSEQGEFLHAVRIVEDITERKRAEEDLQASREELALSNAKNESILNSAGEGIMAIDNAGLITAINPVGAAMIGLPAAEIIGKRPGEAAPLMKGDGSPYGEGEHVTILVLEEGAERRAEGDLLVRADGTVITIDRIITPLRNSADTATVGVVMTMRDVTERAHMERAKAEFLAMTSHELKTPLTAIHAAIGLSASGTLGPLPEKAAALLATASQNSDQLLKLVNEIVELERLNMGEAFPETEHCDAGALLEDVASELGALAEEAGVVLRVQGQAIMVPMDRDRISRTLVNLVGNAIKFSPTDAEVVLACRVTTDQTVCEVTDSGPGIPREFAGQIFEPFRQVRGTDSSNLGGSGLGLAISKGIVEQHRGRVWVESELGQGSTFKFTLPLARS
jgi:PAS domain S-box-containing protein